MPDVVLTRMSEEEYIAWYAESLTDYAADHARTGLLSPDNASEQAAREFQSLLPDGLKSKDMHLYSVRRPSSSRAVGMIWFAERGTGTARHAFVYDVVIWPEFRGQGYGKSTMAAVEAEVRSLGLQRIGLHVFGHNKTAIHVYEDAGCQVTT